MKVAKDYSLDHLHLKNKLFIYTDDVNEYVNLHDIAEILDYKKGESYLKSYYGLKTTDSYIKIDDIKDMLSRGRKINCRNILQMLEKHNGTKVIKSGCKQAIVTSEIIEEFSDLEIPIENHKCGKYYVDLYFSKLKLAIEIDEHGHKDRDPKYELVREEYIKEVLQCKIHRIDPDEIGFTVSKMLRKLRTVMRVM